MKLNKTRHFGPIDQLRVILLVLAENKSIYGKSVRIVCAPTYSEYRGQKVLAVRSTVQKERLPISNTVLL